MLNAYLTHSCIFIFPIVVKCSKLHVTSAFKIIYNNYESFMFYIGSDYSSSVIMDLLL